MNIKIIILTLLSVYYASSFASEYSYNLATTKDIPALLELINTQAILDADKIVIVPEKFRSLCLESAVEKKRMFVAKDNQGTIVGYKKLFVITDPTEQHDILVNEIRCMGEDIRCTLSGEIDNDGHITEGTAALLNSADTTYVYTGGDFTIATHRGHGINSALTDASLTHIKDQIKTHIKENKSRSLAFAYGITRANAGERPGAYGDRTPSIAQSFRSFAQDAFNPTKAITFAHHRYQAFKPSFDPSSQELRPLPDNKSIEGFGCLLTYDLGENNEQQA